MAVETEQAPLVGLLAEELFDAVGPAYEAAFEGLPGQAAAIQWLVSTLPPSQKIVDIGCGTGKPVCSTLADAGHDVLGIDISGAMISAAKERVPNAKFEQIDMRAYLSRTAPGSLDAATVFFSMIASVTQEEIRSLLKELFRVLRPGGLFVFATVPLPAEKLTIKWMGKPVTVSSLAPEDAVESLKNAGFEIVEQKVETFLPKGAEAGICGKEDVWEETHLFVYARKPE